MAFNSDIYLGVQAKNLSRAEVLTLIIENTQINLKKEKDFLSQFSADNCCITLQDIVTQLNLNLQSTQALQASAYVGRKIIIVSNTLVLDVDTECRVLVDVPADIDKLQLAIYSETSQLIRKIVRQACKPGLLDLIWDGLNECGQRAHAGKYLMKVVGLYNTNETIILKTMISANIDSVSLSRTGNDIKLTIAGFGDIVVDKLKRVDG